jgi:hypothetical protein
MTLITTEAEIEDIGTCGIELFAITNEKLQLSDSHVSFEECQED